MTPKTPLSKKAWEANLKQAAAVIQAEQTFLFSADIDPDSLGSMLSLSLYLRLLNKKVYVVITSPLGENFDFLENIIKYNSIQILRNPEEISRIKNQIDTVIFCDTANTKLVPHYSFIASHILSRDLPVIEIDHHFGADSEEMVNNGIKLFREANANTEIIGDLLNWLAETNPGYPKPFEQRNILLCLITGLLGDTVGGKVVPLKENYEYWIRKLGLSLGNITWDKTNNKADSKNATRNKFSSPQQILDYLHRLSEKQQACLDTLKNRIVNEGGVGNLNLLNSTYSYVKEECPSFNSENFAEILGFLPDLVSEETGKIGVVYYHGKNAEGMDCIFLKMRRSTEYSGIDLRQAEPELQKTFHEAYMGGGGHPGAVSFRFQTLEEKEFLTKLDPILGFLKSHLH